MVTSALLLSVYVTFSIGVLKASHYCMGREASVKFFSSEAKKCPCALFSGERSDCCHDEHELVKIDDEQKIISSTTAPIPVWKLERLFTHQLITFQLVETESFLFKVDDSSPPPNRPLFKLYHSYVFYDDNRA